MSDEALPHFTTEMKRYNARRRFRAGIMAAKTISSLSVSSVKKRTSASDVGHSLAAATALRSASVAAPASVAEEEKAAPQ